MRYGSAIALVVGLTCASSLQAQEPLEDCQALEDRLVALERQVATLETRLATRSTVGAGSLASSEAGLLVQSRLDHVERDLAEVIRKIDRLSSQAAGAQRDASEAKRTAKNALNTAKQALTR
jgi:hypothetical protein